MRVPSLLLLLLSSPAWAVPDAALPDAAPAPDAATPIAAPDAAKPPVIPPELSPAFSCEPSPAPLGAKVRCALTLHHPKDVSVTVVPPPEVELAPGGPAEPQPDGRLLTTRRFTVQPLSPEPIKLGAVTVHWQRVGGDEGDLALPTLTIPVKSLLTGVTDAKPRTFEAPLGAAKATDEQRAAFFAAHGPLPLIRTNWALIIGLGGLVLVGLGLLLGVFIHRYLAERRRRALPPVDTRPAHVIALEALDQLAAQALPEQGEVKRYYSRLSEIVRDYLDRRFDFSAPEMTSDEIRATLGTLPLALEAKLAVEDFLAETDLVKFADFNPTDSAIDTVMRMARGIVELTREADAPVVAEGGTP